MRVVWNAYNGRYADNPLGALVSSAFAAMELFRNFLRTLVPGEPVADDPAWWDLAAATGDVAFSLLDYSRDGTGHEYDPLPADIDLGEVAFVSAGAMAQDRASDSVRWSIRS